MSSGTSSVHARRNDARIRQVIEDEVSFPFSATRLNAGRRLRLLTIG